MTGSLLLLLLPLAGTPPVDTVVVCPREFREALGPWLSHRTQQGHSIELTSNLPSAEGIREQIRQISRNAKLRFIVLVGDAEPAMERDSQVRARCVPTHHAAAKVNVHWGSEPQIASDNWYADLDDDGLPDVAVGRLTADSPAELSRIVKKILDYEESADFGDWRRRINLVAGLGGFGGLIDGALELATKRLITDGIPSSYATSMTYGSWQSPYCPDPRGFHQMTLDRLQEGCLFWVYLGHGQRRWLDQVRVPGAAYPILSDLDVPRLHCQSGASIACFLACYAAAFDQKQDCLAEEMLRTEGAPVAILGGSRVTMPYGMARLALELMDEVFARRPATFGEAVLGAKRNMIAPTDSSERRNLLDALAGLLSPASADLAVERAEHVELFNLIGDPTLRLQYPHNLQVEVNHTVSAGQPLRVMGACPIGGQCSVELVVRRDRMTFTPPARVRYDSSGGTLAAYDDVYRRANDPRLAEVKMAVKPGRFETQVQVPPDARGACHVRVFVAGQGDFASGAADVEVGPLAR